MKRRGFLLALAAGAMAPVTARAERYARGVLWRVTKGGRASHLFGTLHEPDARLAVAPSVGAAFDGARSLMVEFMPDAYAQERFLEAALFPDGQTLEEKVGPHDFARVLEQLAPIGLPREFLLKLKPWGALINLRRPLAADSPPSLDAQLIARARARRLPIEQVEGVEEQIFTFDECPMETQVALLKHSLAHRNELIELSDATIEAYLLRDLEAIWRLRERFIARHPEVAAHQSVMTKRVLHDRSVVMAYRMQRELRRGGAFVALGALHLYGARGVLALLEADGYRATRVL